MEKITSNLENIEAIFLDLDGTIYMGDNLIDGAIDFLNRIEERGIKRFFLSNNSSKSVAQYLVKLEKMGIPANKEEVLLSTHDLLSWLKAENISETYLVGTEGMKEMLEEVGINTNSKNPQFVVLGYDTEITYEKLTNASIYLHRGVPLVVSHPDMVCPSPNGGLPDTGAYLALFEATTGVTPKHICGKPNPGMILPGMKPSANAAADTAPDAANGAENLNNILVRREEFFSSNLINAFCMTPFLFYH